MYCYIVALELLRLQLLHACGQPHTHMLAPRTTCAPADSFPANHAHASVQAVSTHVTNASSRRRAEVAERDPGVWLGLRGTFRMGARVHVNANNHPSLLSGRNDELARPSAGFF